ncbi:MAG: NADPH-dependent FMN reductase [Candidatus Binataceae bacterium]
MGSLIGILGSVTPPGRSLRALEFAMRAAHENEPDLETGTLNLADYRISFADGRSLDKYGDDTASVVGAIAQAEAVILASPVYRGSLSGVLKNLLDHVPVEALRDKPCGIIAIGASQHHFLGVEWHLRNILSWFGALTAPNAVYLTSADFVEGEPSENARRDLAALVATVLRLRAVAGSSRNELGPTPLAARRG